MNRFDPSPHLARAAVVCVGAVWMTGCSARVPDVFDPAPPRLAPDSVEVSDHTGDDEIVVLVFGDAGTGSENQIEIGRRMAEECDAAGCDLGLMLGDNFYFRGVDAPKGGRWDRAFERKFERPYRALGRIDMWAVAGNHDWYKGRDSIDTLVAYSERSDRWRMLSYDYAIPNLPEWLSIYGLDTALIDEGVEIGQLERARDMLCDAPGWKILFGHHAVFTSGHHGAGRGVVATMNESLRPFIEECAIQVYLAGHDHHQEHLVAGSFHQIIQGAGGKTRPVVRRSDDYEASQLFAARKYGFAILRIRRDTIDIAFYGYAPGRPEGFETIYDARIEAERVSTSGSTRRSRHRR